MKKILFFIALAFSTTVFSQAVFVVQNATSSSAHSTLEAAITAAVDGDYIYLPGGIFGVGNLSVNKRVHIFGAGHYPDSTQATGRTALSGNIYFVTGSSNSVLQGVYLSGDIFMGSTADNGVVSNILISRCNVYNISLNYLTTSSTNYGAENIFIKDCIIRNNINGASTQGVVVENSIITYQIKNFDANAEFRNNIFLRNNNYSNSSGYCILNNISNCNFSNNIFRHSYNSSGGYFAYSSSNNFFNNCIFGAQSTYIYGGTFSNCLYATDFSTLFVNVPSVEDFSYTYDYHLSETSAAIGAGLNGTDCGIYGGDNPYKDGAVPLNPHIQFKQIPTATDSQGKLNIQVTVSAQEN
ncbi:MAG TPA: hypothetical protein PKN32_14875 [Bacteroidales bacterium]|nr:hypothetical protein [Bacteroidales bacterium]